MPNAISLIAIHNYRAVDHALCTSGQPTVGQLAEIAAASYEVIINLALHDNPRYSLLHFTLYRFFCLSRGAVQPCQ